MKTNHFSFTEKEKLKKSNRNKKPVYFNTTGFFL